MDSTQPPYTVMNIRRRRRSVYDHFEDQPSRGSIKLNASKDVLVRTSRVSIATVKTDGVASGCMAVPRWIAIKSATPAASRMCWNRTPCSPRNRALDTSQNPLQVAEPPIAIAHFIHSGAMPIQGDIKDSASDPLTTANRTSEFRLVFCRIKASSDSSAIATADAVNMLVQLSIDTPPSANGEMITDKPECTATRRNQTAPEQRFPTCQNDWPIREMTGYAG